MKKKIFDVWNCSNDQKISFATFVLEVENNKNTIGNESESNNKRVKTSGFENGCHNRRLNDVDGLYLGAKFWSYLFVERGMINLED